MQAGLSTKNAPSPKVVVPHYAAGVLFFLVAAVLILIKSESVTQFYFGPDILAVTHLLVLGWITLIIFGALYQLIPVVMEVKLKSELLAHISLYSMILGVLMLSHTFMTSYISGNWEFYTAAVFIGLSVVLFAVNVVLTALKTKQKTVENLFIVTSGAWLLLTILLGIFIPLNTAEGWLPKSNLILLKVHMHIGVLGWFLTLVTGVASKLLPMFFIAHKLKIKFLKASYIGINLGLILLAVALYSENFGALFYTAIVLTATGFGLFIRYNFDAFKARLRKKLDIGMRITVWAFAFLGIALVAGILSAVNLEVLSSVSNSLKMVYGSSLILGFLTSLIFGQMYKTLPFIVWLKLYQDKVGKFKTPMPAAMYSELVAKLHFYTHLSAMFMLFGGMLSGMVILTQIGAVLLVATALLFGFNTLRIIFHKQKLEAIIKK